MSVMYYKITIDNWWSSVRRRLADINTTTVARHTQDHSCVDRRASVDLVYYRHIAAKCSKTATFFCL